MDQEGELARFKFVAFSLLVFAFAAFKSCEALKCAVSSTRTTATVRSIAEERTRQGVPVLNQRDVSVLVISGSFRSAWPDTRAIDRKGPFS